MRCVWWFPHKGNFWEVRGQLLRIPPPNPPQTSQKVLRKIALWWLLFFFVWREGLCVPWPSNPRFFRFPHFFRLAVFLAFLCIFALFFQGFRGFCREENPRFFRGILAFFCQKSKDWRVRAIAGLLHMDSWNSCTYSWRLAEILWESFRQCRLVWRFSLTLQSLLFWQQKGEDPPKKSEDFPLCRTLEMHMSKDGSIWQLFVLCLLALVDTVPRCYVLLEGFNEPKKPYKTGQKRQSCQIDPCFSPLHPWNPWKREQKRTKKQGKPQNEKSEENEKSEDSRVRVHKSTKYGLDWSWVRLDRFQVRFPHPFRRKRGRESETPKRQY